MLPLKRPATDSADIPATKRLKLSSTAVVKKQSQTRKIFAQKRKIRKALAARSTNTLLYNSSEDMDIDPQPQPIKKEQLKTSSNKIRKTLALKDTNKKLLQQMKARRGKSPTKAPKHIILTPQKVTALSRRHVKRVVGMRVIPKNANKENFQTLKVDKYEETKAYHFDKKDGAPSKECLEAYSCEVAAEELSGKILVENHTLEIQIMNNKEEIVEEESSGEDDDGGDIVQATIVEDSHIETAVAEEESFGRNNNDAAQEVMMEDSHVEATITEEESSDEDEKDNILDQDTNDTIHLTVHVEGQSSERGDEDEEDNILDEVKDTSDIIDLTIEEQPSKGNNDKVFIPEAPFSTSEGALSLEDQVDLLFAAVSSVDFPTIDPPTTDTSGIDTSSTDACSTNASSTEPSTTPMSLNKHVLKKAGDTGYIIDFSGEESSNNSDVSIPEAEDEDDVYLAADERSNNDGGSTPEAEVEDDIDLLCAAVNASSPDPSNMSVEDYAALLENACSLPDDNPPPQTRIPGLGSLNDTSSGSDSPSSYYDYRRIPDDDDDPYEPPEIFDIPKLDYDTSKVPGRNWSFGLALSNARIERLCRERGITNLKTTSPKTPPSRKDRTIPSRGQLFPRAPGSEFREGLFQQDRVLLGIDRHLWQWGRIELWQWLDYGLRHGVGINDISEGEEEEEEEEEEGEVNDDDEEVEDIWNPYIPQEYRDLGDL